MKSRRLSLFLTFLKIGAFTFGGGYAMIALLEHELIEKRAGSGTTNFSIWQPLRNRRPAPSP